MFNTECEQNSVGYITVVVKVADPLLMREINKYNVLETIRRHGKISRVEISERTQLSPTTVSAITSALLEEGLIQAIHSKPNGSSQRGRPRVSLDLIPDAAYVVGVLISKNRTIASIANFKGEAVSSITVPVRIARWQSETMVDLIEDTVRETIKQSGVDPIKIKGIGIGVPGIVDPKSGRSHSSLVFGAREMPIGALLEERMGISVQIERPSNLIALAENWFGHAQKEHSFVVVTIDDTAGLSIFLSDELHRGASDLGPTFAHVKVNNQGRLCDCGQYDCLHTYVAPQVLLQKWADGKTSDNKLVKAQDFVDLCADAAAGGKQSGELIAEQCEMLGIGLSHIINLLNPKKIIVVVETPEYQKLASAAIEHSAKQNSFAAHFDSTEIIFSVLDEQMWARGAAALMLKDFYSAPWTA